mmetsp:Transcript_86067/g.243119  ORF Transcript_86067/g.243119 Transcript_86067/m.243119 type:complete len:268 (+) Transcript_86067:651-1454(+)
MRNVLHVHDRWRLAAQKPRSVGLPKCLIDPVHALAETRHSTRTERAHAWPESELAPGAEKLAFELEKCVGALELRRVARRQRRIVGKGLVEDLHDDQTLGDHLAIELDYRQEARGDLTEEPLGFIAVAPHGHLLDLEGDLLLLEQQPHLLAVRAPASVVAVERHANVALALPEEAELVVGVGWAGTGRPQLRLGLHALERRRGRERRLEAVPVAHRRALHRRELERRRAATTAAGRDTADRRRHVVQQAGVESRSGGRAAPRAEKAR